MTSRVAVGVLAALLCVGLIVRVCNTRCCISMLRRLRRGQVYPGSAIEGQAVLEDDPAVDVVSGAELNEAAVEAQSSNNWSVLLAIGNGSSQVTVPLPRDVADSSVELRQALSELAGEILGANGTPRAWTRGDLGTMLVQYLDTQVRAE